MLDRGANLHATAVQQPPLELQATSSFVSFDTNTHITMASAAPAAGSGGSGSGDGTMRYRPLHWVFRVGNLGE